MSGTLTDADLIRAAQHGDPASLGLLLARHHASMQAVALALLGYRPEAQDAVQDAMLIALQRLGDLRDPQAAGPWLRAIARNACRMRLRAARADNRDIPALLNQPPFEPSPEELLDRHALRDWVWHAVEALSEPLQLVILLRYFSGIASYSQIAALCGVPVGTIRSRLNQARLRLSDALLASASGAHNDAALLTAERRREAAALLTAAECGEFGAALAASWAPDLELIGPNDQWGRGREFLVRVMEGDLNAGVHQRLAQVTASSRFTIMECDLLSPPWDPEHCPPGVVWLLTLRGGQVERARLFHPKPSATEPM